MVRQTDKVSVELTNDDQDPIDEDERHQIVCLMNISISFSNSGGLTDAEPG
jgi:hypothetical protein